MEGEETSSSQNGKISDMERPAFLTGDSPKRLIQGFALGAVLLTAVGFNWFGGHGFGWMTAGRAAEQAQAAVRTALIPGCVKDVMADSTAAAELLVKRKSDYDDVVRDQRKRVNDIADYGPSFNRECGRAIETKMTTAAVK